MTLPDDIELAKELDDYLQNGEWGVTIFAGHRDVLVNELVKFVATERTKTAKAYGGCTNCYGKGYATHVDATTAYADFGDEFGGAQFVKTTSQEMLFCKCERGQALAKLLDKENV